MIKKHINLFIWALTCAWAFIMGIIFTIERIITLIIAKEAVINDPQYVNSALAYSYNKEIIGYIILVAVLGLFLSLFIKVINKYFKMIKAARATISVGAKVVSAIAEAQTVSTAVATHNAAAMIAAHDDDDDNNKESQTNNEQRKNAQVTTQPQQQPRNKMEATIQSLKEHGPEIQETLLQNAYSMMSHEQRRKLEQKIDFVNFISNNPVETATGEVRSFFARIKMFFARIGKTGELFYRKKYVSKLMFGIATILLLVTFGYNASILNKCNKWDTIEATVESSCVNGNLNVAPDGQLLPCLNLKFENPKYKTQISNPVPFTIIPLEAGDTVTIAYNSNSYKDIIMHNEMLLRFIIELFFASIFIGFGFHVREKEKSFEVVDTTSYIINDCKS